MPWNQGRRHRRPAWAHRQTHVSTAHLRFNSGMQAAVPARRRSAFVILVALAALAIGWVVVPPHSVPLYDGIGFPDEPYRYVAPPAGSEHTAPATTATALSDAGDGRNLNPFYANSGETGPQVSVYVGVGVLVVPAGTGPITLTATPLAPDVQPPNARSDGNVYRITADVAGTAGEVTVRTERQSADSTVTMRATTARQPRPSFYFRPRPTDAWQSLDTARVGSDVYRTDLKGFGDYVLAFTTSQATSGGGSNATFIAIVIAGGIIVVLSGAILVIRLRRGGAQS
jgi:hypothetical protein